MPETLDSSLHVKPFVYETSTRKALHFSISETQSRMDVRNPDVLDVQYTRTMMAFLLFVPHPRYITMIGLGGGSLAKFCHRNLPDAHIDVVEINPHVIELRKEFHVPPDGERFRVIAGDGARFVRERAARCDVLMVDGFDSGGLPKSLCSQRFYDDAHETLQPDGVMVANLHYGHADHAIHVERIRRAFGGAILVVDDGERSNSIVFACKGSRLERCGAGKVRPSTRLDREAGCQLQAAFALVASAWRDQLATNDLPLLLHRPGR
jgi:spermidine synthase